MQYYNNIYSTSRQKQYTTYKRIKNSKTKPKMVDIQIYTIIIIIIIIIYYATKAAQENTNIQTYKTYKKHVKPYAIKLQWNYKYAATDPANAYVTAPFILSLDAMWTATLKYM